MDLLLQGRPQDKPRRKHSKKRKRECKGQTKGIKEEGEKDKVREASRGPSG